MGPGWQYRSSALGVNRGEVLVELAGMVEDSTAELIFGPCDQRHIRLGQIAKPTEGLIAVARGVEEVPDLLQRLVQEQQNPHIFR